MLDKIKNGVKDIPISAEAFGFAAVVASVAPVPDAIGSLATSIRYVALSHSVWSVLQPAITLVLFILTMSAFCRNSWKIGSVAFIASVLSLTITIWLSLHGISAYEPTVLCGCSVLYSALFTVKNFD